MVVHYIVQILSRTKNSVKTHSESDLFLTNLFQNPLYGSFVKPQQDLKRQPRNTLYLKQILKRYMYVAVPELQSAGIFAELTAVLVVKQLKPLQ